MLRIIGKENNRFLLPSSAKAHSRKISFLLALYCVAFCTLAFGQIKTTSARASVLSGVAMSLNHVHDSSASYCNGSTLLFYNANTGEAASGVVNSTGFQTIKTFAPGAFAKGWTSVANADSLNLLMFYNSYTEQRRSATQTAAISPRLKRSTISPRAGRTFSMPGSRREVPPSHCFTTPRAGRVH